MPPNLLHQGRSPRKGSGKLKKILVGLLFFALLLAPQIPAGASAATCSLPANPFVLTNTVWGTPANPLQVQPGDTAVPLTVSLLYVGCEPVLYGSFSLALSPGFTATNPQQGSTVYLQNIQPFSVLEVTFELNLAPSPQLLVGTRFSSTLDISFTIDGTYINFYSVSVTNLVLGRASLSFVAAPQSLIAGQVNDLALSIQNNGTAPASQVTTTLSSPSALSVLGSVPEVDTISALSTYTRIVPVFVPSTAAGQPLSILVSSTYVDPYSNVRTVTQTIDLFSPAGPEAVSLGITQSSDNLTAGDVTAVTFTISNGGSGPADNLTVAVAGSQSLTVLSLPPKITTLAPSSQASFPLDLYAGSTAAGTALGLTFTVTYQDPYGISKVYTQNVGFYSPSLNQVKSSPLSIVVRPDVLVAGRGNNLTVSFQNVGNETITSLSVSFGSPTGSFTWLSPNQAEMEELPPGGNFTVNGSLYDSSETAPSTTLELSITYYEGTVLTQETRSLGLLSRGEIDIALTSLAVLPQVATPGSIVSLTLTLTNLGIISATGVTANLAFPTSFSAVGSSSDFVGDMEVDSPSTITFSALVSNSTAPGTYTVPVKLTYFDNLRDQISQNLSLTVSVSSGSQSGQGKGTQPAGVFRFGLVLDVVVILVLVLIVVLVVRRLRRPKS